MKILVFGSTGKTGREVVRCALQKGHEVVAVSRRIASGPAPARLTAYQGNVLAADSIRSAFPGMDAVICCLGPDSNLSPGKLMSAGLANIVAEAEGAGVKSLVMMSGITLSTGDELSVFNRWVVRFFRRIFHEAAVDKLAAERLVQASALRWVIVRAVGLKDAPPRGSYTAGPAAKVTPLLLLPFADCAACLLRATLDRSWANWIVNVGR